jgi:hypothetical protein
MPIDLRHLQGKRFCVVLMEDSESSDPTKVKIRPMLGRANIDKQGNLKLEHSGGAFMVPSSCYPTILPSDGTDILEDAEYYVFCKLSGMKL